MSTPSLSRAHSLTTHSHTDTPTPKFGEALRQQVEERLTFFESGAPPGKNADAIRKVLDQLELEKEEEGEEDNMMEGVEQALPLIEAEPPRKKYKSKKDKKDKKKKRKLDEMEMDVDVDEDDGAGDVPVKKVKLSKEEKKALKKEKRLKQTEEGAGALAEVSDGLSVVCL